MSTFPWITIPRFAQPGQTHAFANREEKIAQLYKGLVAAGNAVRNHECGVRHRYVVSGYMGVGKSALILQVLAMLRDEAGVSGGSNIDFKEDLPEPENRQRWLILRASGKQVRSFDALADALQRSILAAMEDVVEAAERAIPHVLRLPIWHRLLPTRESRLFARVRSTLEDLVQQIVQVREFQDGTETKSLANTATRETSRHVEGSVEMLPRGSADDREPRATLSLGGSMARTNNTAFSERIERRSVVSVQRVVESLNRFFRATDSADVPTILVLDDFDEFVSNVGPSHSARFEILSQVLGAFNQLAPTCLIIGLREEYMHEDVHRQFRVFHVPPLTRASAAQALDVWAGVQQPPLPGVVVDALKALGDRFLQPFAMDDSVVIPVTFLQLVTWITNNVPQRILDPPRELLLRYLRSEYPREVVRTIEKIARAMPTEDIPRCAEAESLDPTPYGLTEREYQVLARAGLLRPAMAGDHEDRRIILDPLCAYLRAAA